MTPSATNTACAGPWGVSFTANLTPDAETGLGKWTQRNFTETIRTGRHMGRGREVLPPMPIPVYKNFTDADLAAIYTYLRIDPGGEEPRARAAAPSGRRGREVTHVAPSSDGAALHASGAMHHRNAVANGLPTAAHICRNRCR